MNIFISAWLGLTLLALGNDRFPCHQIQFLNKSKPKVVQVLYGKFGNNWQCLNKIYNKEDLLLVHYNDETCRRWHNCPNGVIGRHYNPQRWNIQLERFGGKVQKDIRIRIKDIQRDFYGKSYWVSTGLEDNYSKQAYNNIKSLFSKTRFYSNPVRYAKREDIVEVHKCSPFKDSNEYTICSFDGNFLTSREKSKIINESLFDIILDWSCSWQGSCNGYIDIPKRKFEFSKNDINFIKRMLL